MSRDFTEAIRTIDTLQNRMDETFHRPNADPVYHTREAIADAISDNLRYFDADRKAELVEIFFAILEQVYERMVKPENKNPFCNPDAPAGQRLPELEMLFFPTFGTNTKAHEPNDKIQDLKFIFSTPPLG